MSVYCSLFSHIYSKTNERTNERTNEWRTNERKFRVRTAFHVVYFIEIDIIRGYILNYLAIPEIVCLFEQPWLIIKSTMLISTNTRCPCTEIRKNRSILYGYINKIWPYYIYLRVTGQALSTFKSVFINIIFVKIIIYVIYLLILS